MSDESPVIIDSATGEIKHLPPKKCQRYRCKLNNMQDVHREMAKVYRESRSGSASTQDATKQIWMLKAISEVIVNADIELRIEALEEKQL